MAVPDPFDDHFDDDTDDDSDDGDRPGLTPDDAYTVSELSAEIKEVLGEVYRGGIWLQGEINGLSIKNGNSYFTLSEITSDGQRVKIDASFWKGDRQKLSAKMRAAGIDLANDLKVRVKVTVDFYAPFGKLSVHVKDIDPRFTLGELALEREALVRRLKDSGAYDRNKGTSLSPVPLRVGVVTSASSAAWADFLEGIEESEIGFQVMLANVSVQGDLAVGQVSRAIRALSRRDDLDVVVVIRGGGGKDELSTFDAEPIALAIAESPLPVFTGVGHEIDTSVADEVAFRRFKTPTAVATGLVEMVNEWVGRTEEAWLGIAVRATESTAAASAALDLRVANVAARVRLGVDRADERLTGRVDRLGRASSGRLRSARVDCDGLEVRLRLLDPREVMRRGWSIVRRADGRAVRSIGEVGVGEAVNVHLADGTLAATVDGVTSA